MGAFWEQRSQNAPKVGQVTLRRKPRKLGGTSLCNLRQSIQRAFLGLLIRRSQVRILSGTPIKPVFARVSGYWFFSGIRCRGVLGAIREQTGTTFPKDDTWKQKEQALSLFFFCILFAVTFHALVDHFKLVCRLTVSRFKVVAVNIVGRSNIGMSESARYCFCRHPCID